MLTRDDILVALQDAITENQEFELPDEIIDAMEVYPDPFDLVTPILELIANHPEVDFGSPGDLVHFVERFYHKGYEELLMKSVHQKPTVHNIWMLHRCYNAHDPELVEKIKVLIREIQESGTTDVEVSNIIKELQW